MSADDEYVVLAGAEDSETEKKLGLFPNPPLKASPVVPLGYDDKYVYFALPGGAIRKEQARHIAGMLKTDIFCCQAGQSFLTYWRPADDDSKFAAQTCAIWFNRACRDAGLWDDRREIRSLGVWRGGPGEVVLHKGDEIWTYVDGEDPTYLPVIEALREPTGPLYKLFPPRPRPEKSATVEDGRWLRDSFDMWRCEAFGTSGLTGADILAAFVMSSLLGAVPSFRFHVLIQALQGSGKTTLMTLVHTVLGALSGPLLNSVTDAGLRADISGMARPLALDEAESRGGDGGPGPIEIILSYLKLMATGAGANRRMGGLDGGSATQTAVGQVIMAGIHPPPLDDALATRVARFKLLPLKGTDLADDAPRPKIGTDAAIKAATERAKLLAPAFLGRALEGAHRFERDMAAMKTAIIAAGEDPRTADLIAAMAAGRHLLLSDAPFTEADLADELARWRPLLARRAETGAAGNAGADLLNRIMQWPSGIRMPDRTLTIGDVVTKWADGESFRHQPLTQFGLRLYDGPGPDDTPTTPQYGPWLIVSNHHAGMDKITEGTEWRDHRGILEYLSAMGPEYAPIIAKSMKYGTGNQQRGLAIPLAPWLERPMVRVPSPVPSSVPWDVADA